MDRRDDELLAKQMSHVAPPRNDGLVGLTVVSVFIAGLILGGIVATPKHAPRPPHDAFAAISSDAPATVAR